MMSFNKSIKAIVGIAVFAMLATTISCGKKKGGGGAVATAPDCLEGSACTVGQSYASGVFFRSVVGQGYGSNKTVIAKLAFFGQTASGLNLNTNPVTYNGAFVATGTMRLTDGSYSGVLNSSTRAVANFGFGIEFGVTIPGLNFGGNYNNGGYTNGSGGYYTAGGYWVPCGYYSTNCGGYRPPQPPPPQPCYGSNCGGGGYNQCNIPAGDYTVTTVASGNYRSGGYNSESFTGLKLRLTSGSTIVDATINQGQVQGFSNATTTSHTLRGQMVINTVNNVQCNQSVQF